MPIITGQRHDGPRLDFCILGASKSGKTALHTYLRTHPQIFMPGMDSNFYGDKFNPEPKTWQAYCKIFAGAAHGQLLGEGSGFYLSSDRAVPNILKDNPEARFIVMLRNPIDMAKTLHSLLLRRRVEDERSFQKAWELQDARAAGKRIPRLCDQPKKLFYRERCSFASQMERFFQWVPRERVLVHVFEEFFADPNAAYERTLAFLGLPDDGRTRFERVDDHGVPRSAFLHRLALALDLPSPLKRLYRPLKRVVNAFGLRPGSAFLRWTIGREKFAPVDTTFRRRLEAEFGPEVARLEAILGRDLNVWR